MATEAEEIQQLRTKIEGLRYELRKNIASSSASITGKFIPAVAAADEYAKKEEQKLVEEKKEEDKTESDAKVVIRHLENLARACSNHIKALNRTRALLIVERRAFTNIEKPLKKLQNTLQRWIDNGANTITASGTHDKVKELTYMGEGMQVIFENLRGSIVESMKQGNSAHEDELKAATGFLKEGVDILKLISKAGHDIGKFFKDLPDRNDQELQNTDRVLNMNLVQLSNALMADMGQVQRNLANSENLLDNVDKEIISELKEIVKGLIIEEKEQYENQELARKIVKRCQSTYDNIDNWFNSVRNTEDAGRLNAVRIDGLQKRFEDKLKKDLKELQSLTHIFKSVFIEHKRISVKPK